MLMRYQASASFLLSSSSPPRFVLRYSLLSPSVLANGTLSRTRPTFFNGNTIYEYFPGPRLPQRNKKPTLCLPFGRLESYTNGE